MDQGLNPINELCGLIIGRNGKIMCLEAGFCVVNQSAQVNASPLMSWDGLGLYWVGSGGLCGVIRHSRLPRRECLMGLSEFFFFFFSLFFFFFFFSFFFFFFFFYSSAAKVSG